MMRSPLFNDLFSLRDSLEQFANEAFGSNGLRSPKSRSNGSAWAIPMPIDVYATDDRAVILAAVPGMVPDDLDLTIHENTVTLSGTVKNAAEAEDAQHATWYVSELGSGTYRRSVTLPFPVNADEAKATFEHGILRIVLPKSESAKPRKIAISAGSDQAIESGTSQA